MGTMTKRQHTISISHRTPEIPDHYVIKVLARIWERQGHRVEIGSDFSAEADLCILHHNRTRINPTSLPAAILNVNDN
jgi:hypothetical protein